MSIVQILTSRHAAALEANYEDRRVWQNIKAQLCAALPGIIADAEAKYAAPGSEALRKSYAMAQVMRLIPHGYRGRVRAGFLLELIEKAMAQTL